MPLDSSAQSPALTGEAMGGNLPWGNFQVWHLSRASLHARAQPKRSDTRHRRGKGLEECGHTWHCVPRSPAADGPGVSGEEHQARKESMSVEGGPSLAL